MVHTAKKEGFSNIFIFNDTCLKWRRHSGSVGVDETYILYIKRQQKYLQDATHEMMINFTTKEQAPEVCLPLRLDTNYTVTVTEESTKLVLQIPVIYTVTSKELLSNVSIFNKTCVKWQKKAEREEVEETYLFHILGRRWY
uniref:Uncharacterized protein n=1 Tax=Sphenodon punctatus TaxID=8508 RepID=A0A8D0GX08_SPHPU